MKESRPIGRPRQRWRDNIEDGIQEIGVADQREKIRNSEEWTQTLSAQLASIRLAKQKKKKKKSVRVYD